MLKMNGLKRNQKTQIYYKKFIQKIILKIKN